MRKRRVKSEKGAMEYKSLRNIDLIRNEHWIRSMTNFGGFGWDPDPVCRSFQKFRIKTNLDCVMEKNCCIFCYKAVFC